MKTLIKTQNELDAEQSELNQKSGSNHKNYWSWKAKLSNFEDHPELKDSHPVRGQVVEPRIEISVSKNFHDCVYLSCYFENPLDSYGANWDITDSGCFSLKEDEIDVLIEKLKEAKLKMKGNLKKQK